MEKRNWKRSVTLKQRMMLCLAAFFAAFALQLALNERLSGTGGAAGTGRPDGQL